jgi:hypothetical protein
MSDRRIVRRCGGMDAWRIVLGMAALCCLTAGCGDSDIHVERGNDVDPGFFIGETADGGDLSIAVGSIRAVFFRCGDVNEYRRFDPPEPVATDGSFAVEFEANGSLFTLTGEIVSDDRIIGAIAGNAACDGAFVATRCDRDSQGCGDADGDLIPDEVDPVGSGSPTPNRTPTTIATVATTGTATVAPSLTGAATASPTPAATSTPTGLCGNGVLDGDEQCDGNQIDNTSCFEDVCTCEDFCDDAGGALSCNANCTVNFSQCANGPCEF